MQTYIHWTVNNDMIAILAIEHDIFEYPWSEKDFKKIAKQRNTISMTAHHEEEVVGYIVYELHKNHLDILNLGVKRNVWKQGVGSQLVNKLKSKLHKDRRNRICVNIRESNVGTQLFFNKQDFRCFSTIKNLYDDTREDAYNFRYCLAFQAAQLNKEEIKNDFSECEKLIF